MALKPGSIVQQGNVEVRMDEVTRKDATVTLVSVVAHAIANSSMTADLSVNPPPSAPVAPPEPKPDSPVAPRP